VADAPRAVLAASHQVALHDPLLADHWRHGIAMAPTDPAFALLRAEAAEHAPSRHGARGSVADDDALAHLDAIGAQVDRHVRDAVAAILDRGAIPGVLGGSQAAAFGAISALAERSPGFGILHIDAQPDLRPSHRGASWGSSTWMLRVCEQLPGVHHVVQVGVRDITPAEAMYIGASPKITAYTDHELAWEMASGETWMRIAARALRALPERVWVSFDVDGLDPSLCRSTPAPVPGGIGWREAQLLLQLVAQDHTIVGFDLCEVGSNPYDAHIGARLLYRLAGWAIDGRVRE
jgi:agmatinase